MQLHQFLLRPSIMRAWCAAGLGRSLRHDITQKSTSLCRLLCVEHVEELNKPVLYLVSNGNPSYSLCNCCSLAC